MSDEGLAFKAFSGIDEAIAAAVDVGVIDLFGVTDQHQFGITGHAGDDGFCLLRGELLGLIEDEEPVGDGSAADVAESFDFEDSLFHQEFVGFFGWGRRGFELFAARSEWEFGAHEQFESVVDGLEPRTHFFV